MRLPPQPQTEFHERFSPFHGRETEKVAVLAGFFRRFSLVTAGNQFVHFDHCPLRQENTLTEKLRTWSARTPPLKVAYQCKRE